MNNFMRQTHLAAVAAASALELQSLLRAWAKLYVLYYMDMGAKKTRVCIGRGKGSRGLLENNACDQSAPNSLALGPRILGVEWENDKFNCL
jgi:hypothetical protein